MAKAARGARHKINSSNYKGDGSVQDLGIEDLYLVQKTFLVTENRSGDTF